MTLLGLSIFFTSQTSDFESFPQARLVTSLPLRHETGLWKIASSQDFSTSLTCGEII